MKTANNGELQLPPDRFYRNAKTGRYMEGHTPANKGKKWSEYMGKRAQKRAAKGWKNLEKFRPKQRSEKAGRPRKEVVAVLDDGTWGIFPDTQLAAQWTGGRRENIARCCRLNQAEHVNLKTGRVNTDHRYKGVRFYFEQDDTWMQKIQNN